MKAVLPEGFDLDKHLANYPLENYKVRLFNRDHALYILSQITLVPVRNKEIANEMKEGLTPLYSVLLQKVVRNYNDYLQYFVKTGILYTNNIYLPGALLPGKGHSRGYRFTDSYNADEVMQVDFSVRFQKALRKKRREEYSLLYKEYGHLTKWLWPSCQLEIDATTAITYLKLRKQAQLKNPDIQDTKRHPIYATIEKKDPQIQYRHAKANIDCLLSKDIGCSVDKTVGRMHTVLTNMKSDLRNLITHNGEEMVSIDIVNSQPYLSTILFKSSFYEKTSKFSKDESEVSIARIDTKQSNKINIHPLMLGNITQITDNEDFKLYQELVSGKGIDHGHDLYTFMAQRSSEAFGKDFKNRDEVKVGMFEVLFSKNSYSGRTGVKKLFKEIFPSVDALFYQLKVGDHTRLPCLLQSIESYIMLKVITKSISKKCPNAPLFTIHDSIATTNRYKDVVVSIMESELTRLIGLPPKLKLELWNPSNIKWEKYK